ncbi:hypothetical protein LTR08_001245 [Meristemomyces frigidus]|nr:hypothetical protein LTR08_001245 [Meristemomyces frigidus]
MRHAATIKFLADTIIQIGIVVPGIRIELINAYAMPPNPLPKTDSNPDDITILVTGFGPFKQQFPVNPSFQIARSLPQILPKTTSSRRTVHIIGYGSPIRVSYAETRELIPPLLESYHGTVDLVLHIGMASGRQFYAAERYAHRNDYDQYRDLDGCVPSRETTEKLYGDCPDSMTTSLDYEELIRRWQESISDIPAGSPAHAADCRPSEDAGHYLCDYTYFNSLAWYGRRNKQLEDGESSDRPVMFLHVPAQSDEVTLDRGRAVAVGLLQAMADVFKAAK